MRVLAIPTCGAASHRRHCATGGGGRHNVIVAPRLGRHIKENKLNIEDLTVKQIREIAAMVNCQSIASITSSAAHPMIGKHVIARCYAAGVHAGIVVSVDGENVVLKDSRRLWSWKAKDGVALSGVAQTGLMEGGKVDVINPEIYLTGVCELIPTASGVKEAINAYK
jgi:hypothetical protein